VPYSPMAGDSALRDLKARVDASARGVCLRLRRAIAAAGSAAERLVREGRLDRDRAVRSAASAAVRAACPGLRGRKG